MTEQSSSRSGSRRLAGVLLTVVPALGIAALAAGVLPSLTAGSSPVVPSGLLASETREFAKNGDDLSALATRDQPKDVDQFLNDWQNTVRKKASPRR